VISPFVGDSDISEKLDPFISTATHGDMKHA